MLMAVDSRARISCVFAGLGFLLLAIVQGEHVMGIEPFGREGRRGGKEFSFKVMIMVFNGVSQEFDIGRDNRRGFLLRNMFSSIEGRWDWSRILDGLEGIFLD